MNALVRRYLNPRRFLDVIALAIVAFAVFVFLVKPLVYGQRAVPAPSITVTTSDGNLVALGGRRVRPLFVDFWASWCPPCRAAIPLEQAFARSHPGVDVVFIDVGESPAIVSAYAHEHAMSSVVSDSGQSISSAFGVVDLPTMVTVDRAGIERTRWVGAAGNAGDLMQAELRALATRPPASN